MTDVKCAHKGCDLSGKWLPALLISPPPSMYATGVVPSDAVSRAHVGVPICDVHKGLASVDDFVTPEGFAMITAGFTAKGLAAPSPDVGLEFDPLPKCGAGKPDKCPNPAVVQVIWNFPGEGGASLVACSEHIADVRRVLIEHNPAPNAERQEVNLVPVDLWR